MQPAGTTSNGGATETTNVKKHLHTAADLDCQICHEESLKTENSSAKNDKTGHDVQHDQDLPLRTDGACNNTSNTPDANFNIFGPSFTKIPQEGTNNDNGALYGQMNGKTLVDLSLLNQSFSCKCPTICVRKINVKLL